jgi:hypothetical protein
MINDSVIKSFLLKKDIVEQLEELAEIKGESEIKIIEELIEDKYYTLVNEKALSKKSYHEFLEREVVEDIGKLN